MRDFTRIDRRSLLVGAGAAIGASPFGALAQEGRRDARQKIVIAFTSGSEAEIRATPLIAGLLSGLRALGYYEGGNLEILIRTGGGTDDYLKVAEDVISISPDLIIVNTGVLARQIKASTNHIPIIAAVNDPIANGLVGEPPSPTGNVTGVDVNAGTGLYGVRLAMMREAGLKFIRPAFLTPSIFDLRNRVNELRPTWKNLIPVQIEAPINEPTLQIAFRVMQDEGADALLVSNSTSLALFGSKVAALAREYRLPAVYPYRSYVEVGGLMSYGMNFFELGKVAARQADDILRGGSPAKIPFYRTEDFELALNLKAARALNVSLAESVVARAGFVVQ